MIARPAGFEDLSSFFRMAQQEPHESTLGRVGNRECHDADLGALEATNHLQELSRVIFEENGKLADRRVVFTRPVENCAPVPAPELIAAPCF